MKIALSLLAILLLFTAPTALAANQVDPAQETDHLMDLLLEGKTLEAFEGVLGPITKDNPQAAVMQSQYDNLIKLLGKLVSYERIAVTNRAKLCYVSYLLKFKEVPVVYESLYYRKDSGYSILNLNFHTPDKFQRNYPVHLENLPNTDNAATQLVRRECRDVLDLLVEQKTKQGAELLHDKVAFLLKEKVSTDFLNSMLQQMRTNAGPLSGYDLIFSRQYGSDLVWLKYALYYDKYPASLQILAFRNGKNIIFVDFKLSDDTGFFYWRPFNE